MKVVVFDLDDTLYNEISYVESGFRAVAEYLYERYSSNVEESMSIMLNELKKNGRGKVFDRLLEYHLLYSRGRVKECLGIYRQHKPKIELFDDSKNCIENLSNQNIPLYIVTDGNKMVQKRKLIALGLYEHPAIRRCYISRRFGIKNEKPSPYCFLQICTVEKVDPFDVVYIGDNPNKDFVGIKPLGFKTVRILRGGFASLTRPKHFEADIQIRSLDELYNRVYDF
ncbi:HAD family hydrolase [Paenibacillus sp. FSL H7-0714]|uniref:HAD family hydrolase n=1 Tax=Paenibacillus sp. FSL H7-0714 TaxID=2954735 RepID=UPI0030F9AAB0